MSHSFKEFQLKDFLLEALEKMGITTPTAVQEQAIPAILQGRDIVGRSQTGTGKTLAYLLPILQQADPSVHGLQVLILAPTRELTGQIAEVVERLTAGTGIDTVLIQGGVDINRQIQRLRRDPQIIVGTPGRVLDLVTQEKLLSHTARFLVIDEADMMLDLGFREDLEKLIQRMKRNIQIALFAATFPPGLAAMAKAFMKEPYQVEINPGERAVSAIENVFFRVRNEGKEEALIQLVRLYNPYLGIVFVRKKEQVDDLVTHLRQAGFDAEGFHGGMLKGRRKQVMRRFREARSQLIVATDIASRGLDIEGVTHIFSFDLPVSVDQYIHRIGRTGRAGETGLAVNIITAAEEPKLRRIAERLNASFKEKTIRAGEITDKSVSAREAAGPGTGAGSAGKSGVKTKTGKKITGPNARKKAIQEYRKRAEVKMKKK